MNLKSVLETILFVHGEPLTMKRLAELTGKNPEDVSLALIELKRDYKNRGLALLKKEDEWQLGSNPANTKYIDNLIKGEFSEDLSKSALESITIIAYKGPLTRAQLEYVRGVNSSFTLRNLLMRGLVERIENPKDARSFLYEISMDFLKHLGIEKKEDLPQFTEFKKEKMEIPLDGIKK